MKLSKSFITHEMDGTTLLVPMADAPFHGVVKGNKTVAFIWNCLQQDTTEQDIVRRLCEAYDGDPAVMEADVKDVIRSLREIGAIED